MRRLLIALLLLIGGTTPALACSCRGVPSDPVALRDMADQLVLDAAALVEVDVSQGQSIIPNGPQWMRIRQTLVGSAPMRFQLVRRGQSMCWPGNYPPGGRAFVLLFPTGPQHPHDSQFTDGGLCTPGLVQSSEVLRAELVRAFARRGLPD